MAVTFPIRRGPRDLHHEVELVVAIGEGGLDIATDRAREHIFGYAIGIDLTRRDLQGVAKEMGRPWDTGKQFANAAPIGAIHPARESGHLASGAITFAVNGMPRQAGDLGDMIWSIEEIIAELSTLYELMPGDFDVHRHAGGSRCLGPGRCGRGKNRGAR